MKLALSILFSFAFLTSTATINIKGKIVPYRGHTDLAIQVPLAYSLHESDKQAMDVHTDGTFEINLPLTEQKFAYLFIGDKKQLLWLKPNTSLELTINSTLHSVKEIHGNTKLENEVLQRLQLTSIPFFMQSEGNNYPYSKITPTGIQDSVVKPWLAERDKKLKMIRESKLNKADQDVLRAEISYHALNHLSDFVLAIVRWKRPDWTNFITQLYDTIAIQHPPLVKGIQYYLFVDRYTRYLFLKAMQAHQTDSTYHNKALPYLQVSWDSAMTLAKTNGEKYLAWLAIHHTFDQTTAAHYLAQQVLDQYRDGNLAQFTPFFADFEHYFKQSAYYPMLRQYANELHEKLWSNRNNKAIEIFAGYDTIRSIYSVVKNLKGKVIYLDIWGTWCGPCKEEFRYLPRLKEQFEGKDVIFVYLDMDADDKDDQWRDFIHVNEITGIHLRMDNEHIQSIWKELLPGQDKLHGRYPSYFIFDRQGKMVKGKVKRPSDKAALYQQLEKYL